MPVGRYWHWQQRLRLRTWVLADLHLPLLGDILWVGRCLVLALGSILRHNGLVYRSSAKLIQCVQSLVRRLPLEPRQRGMTFSKFIEVCIYYQNCSDRKLVENVNLSWSWTNTYGLNKDSEISHLIHFVLPVTTSSPYHLKNVVTETAPAIAVPVVCFSLRFKPKLHSEGIINFKWKACKWKHFWIEIYLQFYGWPVIVDRQIDFHSLHLPPSLTQWFPLSITRKSHAEALTDGRFCTSQGCCWQRAVMLKQTEIKRKE